MKGKIEKTDWPLIAVGIVVGLVLMGVIKPDDNIMPSVTYKTIKLDVPQDNNFPLSGSIASRQVCGSDCYISGISRTRSVDSSLRYLEVTCACRSDFNP